MKLASRLALLTVLSIAMSQVPVTRGIINQLTTVTTQAATNGIVKVVLPAAQGYISNTTGNTLKITLCGDVIDNDKVTKICYKMEATTGNILGVEDFEGDTGIGDDYQQYTDLKEVIDEENNYLILPANDDELTFEEGKSYKIIVYQCTATHVSEPLYIAVNWNEDKKTHEDKIVASGESITYYLDAEGKEVSADDINEKQAHIILSGPYIGRNDENGLWQLQGETILSDAVILNDSIEGVYYKVEVLSGEPKKLKACDWTEGYADFELEEGVSYKITAYQKAASGVTSNYTVLTANWYETDAESGHKVDVQQGEPKKYTIDSKGNLVKESSGSSSSGSSSSSSSKDKNKNKNKNTTEDTTQDTTAKDTTQNAEQDTTTNPDTTQNDSTDQKDNNTPTTSHSTKKAITTFSLGQTKYVINGVERSMDAKVYVGGKGCIMVPVRYLLDAIGVNGNSITYSKDTITIKSNGKTIVLKGGSDIAQVDGKAVKLGANIEIKNNRTFVPMGQIAKILGVQVSWDNKTKTATFSN